MARWSACGELASRADLHTLDELPPQTRKPLMQLRECVDWERWIRELRWSVLLYAASGAQ